MRAWGWGGCWPVRHVTLTHHTITHALNLCGTSTRCRRDKDAPKNGFLVEMANELPGTLTLFSADLASLGVQYGMTFYSMPFPP